jgi:hypothetical protein
VNLAAQQPAIPEWLSRIDLSGVAYLAYRYEMTAGASAYNTFDVTRMYLSASVRPAPHVRFRMTLDAPNREAVTRVSGGTTTVSSNAGKFDIVLKHAYAEFYDILRPGLYVRFGMHDLPWVPFEERTWGYRFQGTVFPDREGYLTSTDVGVGAGYADPERRFEVHASLVNGEGWTSPEVSKQKDVHARVTVRPLRAFALSAFASTGAYQDGADQARRRFIVQAAYERPLGVAAVEYLRASDPPSLLATRQPSLARSAEPLVDARGWSAFGWLDLAAIGWPRGLRVIARLEHLDPEDVMADNAHTRVIVGAGYRVNALAHILADYETISYSANSGATAGTPLTDEKRLFLHMLIGF